MGAGHRARGFHQGDEAALGLAFLSESGCQSVLRFLAHEGPDAVWRASRQRLLDWGMSQRAVDRFEEKRRSFMADEVMTMLARAGLRFIAYGSAHYPPELAHLRHPPAGLFVRATDDALASFVSLPRVTIVGTRKATAYGLRVTALFASAFAAAGVWVVSGLALGIDGRAHQAALDTGGHTAAVLGCGADVIYPRRHHTLYGQLAARGVIVSELPPGTMPTRWTFPHRNRLLAALGDAVLVSEGSLTSGALQTVDWALQLGRPVFTVPGPITVEGHEGCNQLLYQGAIPALDPFVAVEDFFMQTRIEREERKAARQPGGDGDYRGEWPTGNRQSGRSAAGLTLRADGLEARRAGVAASSADGILEALESGACSVDDLVRRTGLMARRVAAALAEMELEGIVRRGGAGLFIRAP